MFDEDYRDREPSYPHECGGSITKDDYHVIGQSPEAEICCVMWSCDTCGAVFYQHNGVVGNEEE